MGSNSLAETIAEHLLADFKGEPCLPSERKLTEYYNCNRMTIRRALQLLTERGLLSNSSRKRFFSEEVKNRSANAGKKQPVVMVLSFEKELLDHTRTYMLGGIAHEAARCGLKLVFRELTEAMLEKMTSCEDIDDLLGRRYRAFFESSSAFLRQASICFCVIPEYLATVSLMISATSE